jgi:dCMP deaminase
MPNQNPNRITFPEMFMGMAYIASQRSGDPRSRHGAILVNEQNNIIATGYNHLVAGVEEDSLDWSTEEKYKHVNHAELNALLSCSGSGASCLNATLYVTGPCCYGCAKALVRSGVSKVVYGKITSHMVPNHNEALELFDKCGIIHEEFEYTEKFIKDMYNLSAYIIGKIK